MPHEISYIALSKSDLDNALRTAARRPQYMDARGICEAFGISHEFLQTLVESGRVIRYAVPGHRLVRYDVNQVESQFKPII